MWCAKCQNDAADCTCGDFTERLRQVAAKGVFIFRACKLCGEHYAKCKCEKPEWEVVGA
jgi:hypothetical protein